MEWLEIIVHTTTEAQEVVSNLLIDNGVTGTSIMDRSIVPDITKPGVEWELYDASLLEAMPEDVEVHAWLEINETLQDRLTNIHLEIQNLKNKYFPFPLGELKIEQLNVNDIDWKDTWKQYYKPLRVGKNIVVKPSWEEYSPLETDIIIELDPGMAFGTGGHATTYMCLELLEKYIQAESKVIDIGTGSGILAIASALLGAKQTLGVDINDDAVLVAKENVNKNGLASKIKIKKSDLLQAVNEKYDIAVANIIADAVIILTPDVTSAIKTGGIYIVSGILAERADDVIACATSNGFTLLETLHKDEWVGIAFQLSK